MWAPDSRIFLPREKLLLARSHYLSTLAPTIWLMNFFIVVSASVAILLSIALFPLLRTNCKFRFLFWLTDMGKAHFVYTIFRFNANPICFFFCVCLSNFFSFFDRFGEFEMTMVPVFVSCWFGCKQWDHLHEWCLSPLCWFHGCSWRTCSPSWQLFFCSGLDC